MPSFLGEIALKTKGEIDLVDITFEVIKKVRESGIKNGIVTVFIPGATGAVTTIEYEHNLLKDFKNCLEELVPKNRSYGHPGNAHSHLRASILGPSVAIPVKNGDPILGTWQQVVFIELDTHPRSRRIIVSVTGE
ncbi:MAG: secondary thiamine-phosphate synthase enzyme YjbQ [Asgard group archaeon]